MSIIPMPNSSQKFSRLAVASFIVALLLFVFYSLAILLLTTGILPFLFFILFGLFKIYFSIPYFIFGSFGSFIFGSILFVLPSLVSILAGMLAFRVFKKKLLKGKLFAISGIVLGLISVIYSLVFIFIFFNMFSSY